MVAASSMRISAEELARDKEQLSEEYIDKNGYPSSFLGLVELANKYIAEVDSLAEENEALKRRDKDRIRAWEAKVSEKDAEIARLKEENAGAAAVVILLRDTLAIKERAIERQWNALTDEQRRQLEDQALSVSSPSGGAE